MPESAPAHAEPTRQVFQVTINAPIDAVWREITRTDAPILCFFNNRMHLGPGGLTPGTKLAMRSPNSQLTGVVGTILVCEPPARFGHTFRFTDKHDPECKVFYELRSLGDRVTEFKLIVEDLPVGTKTAKQMVGGSKIILSTLKSVMENGKPSLGIRVLFGVFGALAPVITPKACKSENWPV
jgi:uncharacterized protein YndB with AHSA1/START domain